MIRRTAIKRIMGNVTVLGFTGGIASGKSSRCKHLVKLAQHKSQQPGVSLGVEYINGDLVGHSVYEPGKEAYHAIVNKFGEGILCSSGASSSSSSSSLPPVDRRALGAIVFSDPDKMRDLTNIVWPALDEALLDEVESRSIESTVKHGNRNTLIILEAAVLIEQGFVKHCRDVFLTSCSPEVAVQRIVSRDGLSLEAATQRVRSQKSVEDRMSFLSTSGFSGYIRHFDTTNCTLEEGLKEVSSGFDEYWNSKLRPRVRETGL